MLNCWKIIYRRCSSTKPKVQFYRKNETIFSDNFFYSCERSTCIRSTKWCFATPIWVSLYTFPCLFCFQTLVDYIIRLSHSIALLTHKLLYVCSVLVWHSKTFAFFCVVISCSFLGHIYNGTVRFQVMNLLDETEKNPAQPFRITFTLYYSILCFLYTVFRPKSILAIVVSHLLWYKRKFSSNYTIES